MAHKDYYKILGVEKSASPDKIKKAYRKLAQQYHPDKTKGDKAAEEKFKEINEANSVLSDPENRKRYDRYGSDYEHIQDSGPASQGFHSGPFRESAGAGRSRPMSEEEFSEIFGGEGLGDVFESIFEGRPGERTHRGVRSIKGQDYQAEAVLSLEEAFHGTVRLLSVHQQTIKLTLKPGIADGQVLRIPGKGGQGIGGAPNGDLYITVRVTADPTFERKGNDLYCTHPVALYTAVLGGKIPIRTFKGMVNMDIPARTQNGKVLRLPGLGMPVYGAKNESGDMYVTISITVPDNLSDAEIALFKQLKELRS
jgi:curved DNA-binding protein